LSLFEFLMVLVSIIIGLGIAEVLTGIAQQVRYRRSSTGYWLHSCVIALVAVALLQSWWELWGLRDTGEWVFFSMVLMIINPSALYLIAHLIFPERGQGSDLKAYYYGQMPPIWWLAILGTVSSTLFRPISFGSTLFHLDNATSAIFIAGFVALAVSRNVILHSIVVPLFLLLLIGDVIIWHPSNTAN
jgi:hypothetical protein